MARGGYRPGAGRPKGSKSGKAVFAGFLKPEDLGPGDTPLEYMLRVIRDRSVDPIRRDRMAIAAAPYCHPRISDQRISKREILEAKAKMAGDGSEWGDDLDSPIDPSLQ